MTTNSNHGNSYNNEADDRDDDKTTAAKVTTTVIMVMTMIMTSTMMMMLISLMVKTTLTVMYMMISINGSTCFIRYWKMIFMLYSFFGEHFLQVAERFRSYDAEHIRRFIFTTLMKVHETLEDPKSRGKCHNLHSNYTL